MSNNELTDEDLEHNNNNDNPTAKLIKRNGNSAQNTNKHVDTIATINNKNTTKSNEWKPIWRYLVWIFGWISLSIFAYISFRALNDYRYHNSNYCRPIVLTYPENISNIKNYPKDLRKSSISIDLVISQFNENIDWLMDIPHTKTIIYTKGDEYRSKHNITKPNYNKYLYSKIVHLSNVGREGHSHLHHIITNYNNLPDYLVFSLASINYSSGKLRRMNNIKNKLLYCINNDKYCCNYNYIDLDEPNQSILNRYYYYYKEKYSQDLYNFQIDDIYIGNTGIINENKTWIKANPRPFGVWLQHNFNHTIIDYEYRLNCGYDDNGIFFVSRENILKHSLKFYQQLYNQVDSGPDMEAPHYIERIWRMLLFCMINDGISV